VSADVCTYTACNDREPVGEDGEECSVDGDACFYFRDHDLYEDSAMNASHRKCVTATLCSEAGEYETTTAGGSLFLFLFLLFFFFCFFFVCSLFIVYSLFVVCLFFVCSLFVDCLIVVLVVVGVFVSSNLFVILVLRRIL
jgi:hypothetical protein